MQKLLLCLAVCLLAWCQSTLTMAESDMRVGRQVFTRSLVGTTAQAAVTPTPTFLGVLNYVVCHDAASASTFLAVGVATDPLTDGVRLAPGQCYMCKYCSDKTLKALRVVGQAAGTGYSVTQQLP